MNKQTKISKFFSDSKVVSLNASFLETKAKKAIVVLLALTFLLSLLYLFQIQSITKNNYLIRKKTRVVRELEEKNSKLAKEYNQLISLENIEEKIEEFDFVETENISYISIPSEFITKKK